MSTAITLTEFKQDLMTTQKAAIENFFKKNEKEAMKFMTSVSNSVQQTPKLLECERSSLINAFMKCAEVGLYPSSVS
jgi:recombinational DNA repair protein RecT